MAFKAVVPGLTMVSSMGVNAYVLAGGDGLALVDTGMPRRGAARIPPAIRSLGKTPRDVRDILVTHYHPDHVGSLAALTQATSARVHAHPLDADVVRTGRPAPRGQSPTVFGKVMTAVVGGPRGADASVVEEAVNDGDELPIAGGIRAIHTPGHTPGHVSYLWPAGRVLFVGDAAASFPRLGWSIVYEDIGRAKQSLRTLAELDFDVAVFGHGPPLRAEATMRFRRMVDRLTG
jgi:glyoxylase-like metal-dependent hydrolase (beta-lactamase superfamily II)